MHAWTAESYPQIGKGLHLNIAGALLDSAMEMAGRGRAAVQHKHTTAAAAATAAADGPMRGVKKGPTGPMHISTRMICFGDCCINIGDEHLTT